MRDVSEELSDQEEFVPETLTLLRFEIITLAELVKCRAELNIPLLGFALNFIFVNVQLAPLFCLMIRTFFEL